MIRNLLALALLATAVLSTGCGYIGDPLPPSLKIPAKIPDLSVVQRGDRLFFQFSLPQGTTDGLGIKEFKAIDLRIGEAPDPFAINLWFASAVSYLVEPPADLVHASHRIPLTEWQGKRIAVAVRTSIKEDRYSNWSNVVFLDVVPALPAPVVQAEATSQGVVKVTWKAVDRPGVSYRIWRRALNPPQPAAEIGASETSKFLDTSAQYGAKYEYSVVVNQKTEKSIAESEPSKAVPTAPVDTFAPSVPKNLLAVATGGKIEISWERSPETDTKGYYVFRSVNNGSFERLGDLVTISSYSDRDVKSGTRYGYTVSAVDQTGNESEKSKAAEATP